MLGDKIKKLRKTIGMTQQELADAVGIKRSTIGMLESNKQGTSNDTLLKLAKILNTTIDYLLSDNAQEPTIDSSNNIEINVPKKYIDKYKVTSRDKKQYLEEMKKANEAFFMDDEFNEEAKKEMLDLMSELFWEAKAMNKRKK